MKRNSVSVEGLRELDAALGELPKATGKNVLRRILKKAGKPIADDANARAPDDPDTEGGDNLNQSYKVSTSLNKAQKRARGKSSSFVEAYVGSTQPGKAVGQEFGVPVSNVPAQSHFRPAWDANKTEALDIIKRDLGDEIVKSAKRLAKKRAKAAAKG